VIRAKARTAGRGRRQTTLETPSGNKPGKYLKRPSVQSVCPSVLGEGQEGIPADALTCAAES